MWRRRGGARHGALDEGVVGARVVDVASSMWCLSKRGSLLSMRRHGGVVEVEVDVTRRGRHRCRRDMVDMAWLSKSILQW